MYEWFDGFTAYTDDSNRSFGIVKVHSNMRGLMSLEQNNRTAEISFLEMRCTELIHANPLRIVLKKNCENTNQVAETWKLTGQITSRSGNSITVALSLVEYYCDGEECIYWDVHKYILRIHGQDKMRETRVNIGLE